MSKRRQGKAKGGRSARHHETQGIALEPERKRFSAGGRDLLADGRAGYANYLDHKAKRDELVALGFVEHKLSAAELEAELRARPDEARAMGLELEEE